MLNPSESCLFSSSHIAWNTLAVGVFSFTICIVCKAESRSSYTALRCSITNSWLSEKTGATPEMRTKGDVKKVPIEFHSPGLYVSYPEADSIRCSDGVRARWNSSKIASTSDDWVVCLSTGSPVTSFLRRFGIQPFHNKRNENSYHLLSLWQFYDQIEVLQETQTVADSIHFLDILTRSTKYSPTTIRFKCRITAVLWITKF